VWLEWRPFNPAYTASTVVGLVNSFIYPTTAACRVPQNPVPYVPCTDPVTILVGGLTPVPVCLGDCNLLPGTGKASFFDSSYASYIEDVFLAQWILYLILFLLVAVWEIIFCCVFAKKHHHSKKETEGRLENDL